MTDVILTSELLERGHRAGEIARMERRGELRHVRRGAWTPSKSDDPAEHHRELLAATARLVSSDAVVSHASAGFLHGLPVSPDSLRQVHWTRSRRGGGRARSQVHVYAAHLERDEIVCVDGLLVTSVARTVVDLARHMPYRRGVMVADAALRAGLDRGELDLSMASGAHRPGAARAGRVVGFADGRSESPGESWSRVDLAEIGWPPSHLQYEVFDGDGVLVGRADFCWEDERILGEFDGKVKYGRQLHPNAKLEEVLFQEKRREDALRDLDWQMVRWVTADLAHPQLIADRLDRAARRSRRTPLMRRTPA